MLQQCYEFTQRSRPVVLQHRRQVQGGVCDGLLETLPQRRPLTQHQFATTSCPRLSVELDLDAYSPSLCPAFRRPDWRVSGTIEVCCSDLGRSIAFVLAPYNVRRSSRFRFPSFDFPLLPLASRATCDFLARYSKKTSVPKAAVLFLHTPLPATVLRVSIRRSRCL